METIEFRGKRYSDEGSWEYGDLCRHKDGAWTINPLYDEDFGYVVNPKTVGQFTGLFDRNGTKIYEGDIIADSNNTMYVCVFEHGCFVFRDKDGRSIANPIATISVIVGNIFENKDLMKGETT